MYRSEQSTALTTPTAPTVTPAAYTRSGEGIADGADPEVADAAKQTERTTIIVGAVMGGVVLTLVLAAVVMLKSGTHNASQQPVLGNSALALSAGTSPAGAMDGEGRGPSIGSSNTMFQGL